MDFATLLVVSVGLAMDAFAVSLGVAAAGRACSPRQKFRLAFHMGLFQGLMAFLGWLAGSQVANAIAQFDHWIALGLLAYVGVGMIRSGWNPEVETYQGDPTRGRTLLMLCIACSLDAMAVGLSLAMLQVNILWASLVIGVVTFGFSIVGVLGGCQLGERFGKRMEILGGVVLNGIGLRILLTHLF